MARGCLQLVGLDAAVQGLFGKSGVLGGSATTGGCRVAYVGNGVDAMEYGAALGDGCGLALWGRRLI